MSEEPISVKNAAELLQYIKDNNIQYVDFNFTDMRGTWQHITQHVRTIDADLLEEGIFFDGSSITGWKVINESDMILMPDPSTAFMDPFFEDTTLVISCDVIEPATMQGYGRDPRSLAKRAEAYLKARDGGNISTLTTHGFLRSLLPGQNGIQGQLQTFIPFRLEQGLGEDTGPILGVFEIVQDLSPDLEAVVRLQGMIIGTSVFMMAGLFVALWLIVARGDKIIARRAHERLKMEERLNHVERLAGLGKMVAAVSHEIKNPLGIIRSTAEVLGKRLSKLAPGNEHLSSIIVQETIRLDRIVTEFLDFARPQKMRIAPAVISDLLARALNFMAPDFAKAKITLVQEVDASATAAVDSDHLYQAILNILVNAVQAMPDGGTLKIRLSQEPRTRSLCLEIADTGIGMSDEVLGQIFTPFFTKKNRGTGLGLAIVKNIIEAQLGQIDVDSIEGQGTVFTIRLPQTDD